MLYETHYQEGKRVSYKKYGDTIAALLFLPPTSRKAKNILPL
ncbi:hypothetical protein [Desulfovibrio sp. An276]|nr:hypothetical protein [Desulfovibrio sp. An276]